MESSTNTTPPPQFYGPSLLFLSHSSTNWTVRILGAVRQQAEASVVIEPSVGSVVNEGSFNLSGEKEHWEFYFKDVAVEMNTLSEQVVPYSCTFHHMSGIDASTTTTSCSYSFRVPRADTDPKTLYFSCNDLPVASMREEDPVAYDAWKCIRKQFYLKKEEADGTAILDCDAEGGDLLGGSRTEGSAVDEHIIPTLHLAIGGGDNLYCDDVKKFIEDGSEGPQGPVAENFGVMLDFYIAQYLRRFTPYGGDAHMAYALATVPMIMQADDHDYINGFGSYTKARRFHKNLGLAAHITRFAFQLGKPTSTTALTAESDMENSTASFRIGKHVALLSLDFRSNRDIEKKQLISMKLFEEKAAELQNLIKDNNDDIQHLVVLFASPIVWFHDSFAEKMAQVTKHIESTAFFATDALDSLRADGNTEQTTAICHRLFAIAALHGVRLTFVSGDIHNAAFGSLRSEFVGEENPEDDVRHVQNWISSPICNYAKHSEASSALTKWLCKNKNATNEATGIHEYVHETFTFPAITEAPFNGCLIGDIQESWAERRNFLVLSTAPSGSVEQKTEDDTTRNEANPNGVVLQGQLFVCNKKSRGNDASTDHGTPLVFKPINKVWTSRPAKPLDLSAFSGQGGKCCDVM